MVKTLEKLGFHKCDKVEGLEQEVRYFKDDESRLLAGTLITINTKTWKINIYDIIENGEYLTPTSISKELLEAVIQKYDELHETILN